jgi:hypothetical protein
VIPDAFDIDSMHRTLLQRLSVTLFCACCNSQYVASYFFYSSTTHPNLRNFESPSLAGGNPIWTTSSPLTFLNLIIGGHSQDTMHGKRRGETSRKALFFAVTGLALGTATAFNGPSPCKRYTPLIFAVPYARQSALEGAVLVEWEQLSELQRRIEDGVHYAHWHDYQTHQDSDRYFKDASTVHRGIFCGFLTTKEDYRRLRSADPDENPPEDYSI